MDDYHTTIGNTVMLARGSNPNMSFPIQRGVMVHEATHAFQFRIYGIWMYLLYLFPNFLGILAILAIFNLWFLLFLTIFFVPYGPFRLRFEMEAVFFQSRTSGVTIERYVHDFAFLMYFIVVRKKHAITVAYENYRKSLLIKD
jgi:hypothetical protein